jgi:putative ABC transport system permease protein
LNNNEPRPSRLAGWLIRKTTSYEDKFSIEGDFEEEFHELAQIQGTRRALWWFWKHLFRSLPFFIRDSLYWRHIMLQNYLKVALRNFRRHKGYSFINIFGLALGMAVCILILLWVKDELSFDRFHEKADRIHRVTMDANVGGNRVYAPVIMTPAAPAMVQEFPEVTAAARLGSPNRRSVQYETEIFLEDGVGYTENAFFEIFTFPFVLGDPKTALDTAYSVVITESTAKKYFGEEESLGKVLKIGGDRDFTVTGIVADPPKNSHIDFHMLCSLETVLEEEPQARKNWFDIQFYTYILAAENTDYKELEAKLPPLVDTHLGKVLKAMGGSFKLELQPLTSIHLHSGFERDIAGHGNITYVYLFCGIALFVLLIAGINFVNLSTARSGKRVQEVGMRKTLGAVRGRLIGQFLGESVLYSFLALFIGILLVKLALPAFRSVVNRELSLNFLEMPWLAPLFIVIALLVGVLAGGYPAFFLSSFSPIRMLRGKLSSKASNRNFRRALVVVQFAISIALIICTLIVYQQIQFMKTKQLGFNKEHVVIIPGIDKRIQESYAGIRSQILAIPGVLDVGASSYVPGRGRIVGGFIPEGLADGQNMTMDQLDVDFDYLPTMGIEMAAGRNFSSEMTTDPTETVLINETAARKIGWEDPVGKNFIFQAEQGKSGETFTMRVIGVTKDFHMASLRQKIEPMIIFCTTRNLNVFSVRIAPENITGTMKLIESKWGEIAPNRPFDFLFLDESFDSQYRAEERVRSITLYFSFLAVFIGCLGLFGMASFTAEQRTKEIGIRKILGASVTGIVRLISREFIVLVLLSNVIAWPAAYYFLNQWLQSFAYRMQISWATFLLAGVVAVMIAVLTVSYQALKAALANPVDSLRYE